MELVKDMAHFFVVREGRWFSAFVFALALMAAAAYAVNERYEVRQLNEWQAFVLRFDCRMVRTTWVKPGPTLYKCNDGIEYERVE